MIRQHCFSLLVFGLFFLSQIAFSLCADTAQIERPKELPLYPTCTDSEKSGCRGWEYIGAVKQSELAVPSSQARFYQWESGDTLCFLFKRGDDSGLNGTHCYNIKNCKVCAYDGGGAETPFDELQQGKTVKDNCSRCHAAGPILPKDKLWNMSFHLTAKLNQKCAKNGGPHWVDAPDHWEQPNLSRRVPAPESCTNCHTFFVKAQESCRFVKVALEDPDGSMKPNAFDLSSPKGIAECKKFALDLNCPLKCE